MDAAKRVSVHKRILLQMLFVDFKSLGACWGTFKWVLCKLLNQKHTVLRPARLLELLCLSWFRGLTGAHLVRAPSEGLTGTVIRSSSVVTEYSASFVPFDSSSPSSCRENVVLFRVYD